MYSNDVYLADIAATRVLDRSRKGVSYPLNIKVYEEEVEQVSEFKYLGAIISADGCLDTKN